MNRDETMQEQFKATKIADNVYWVGAIDWSIRNFHGYNTSRGTTYNAYLITGEKNILIDTVKSNFKTELISRITSILPLENIDYIVSNHAEMDHSGCIVDMINLIKPEKVYASSAGVQALEQHFKSLTGKVLAVKDGETLKLGNNELTFYEAKMLHWPDSMVSFHKESGILFTNDIFGMHLASSERFDDEIDDYVLDYETSKYYANIILPYSNFVIKFLKKLEGFNLNIKALATDHGPVWRSKISHVTELYQKWAAQKMNSKAVIIYDTMWESTTKMADAIGEGLMRSGMEVKIMPLSVCHRSDIITEVLEAGAIIVGSPVLNSCLYPSIPDVLTYIKGLKPQNKVVGAFGSYGWAVAALDELRVILESQMKLDFVGEVLKSQYVPDTDMLTKCYDYGMSIAQRVKEKMINEKVAV